MADYPLFPGQGKQPQAPMGDDSQWAWNTLTEQDHTIRALGEELPTAQNDDNRKEPTSSRGLKDPPYEHLPGDQQQQNITTIDSDDDDDDTGTNEFSGFAVALAKMGETILDPSVVERELKWQNEETMGEDANAQQEFRDQVLQLQTLRAFVLMQEQSSYLTICHSVGKFFNSPGEDAQPLHGQYIGIVGDRQEHRDPSPIILPQRAWEWTTPVVHTAVAAIKEFFEVEENYDRLYVANETTPPPSTSTKATKATKASLKVAAGATASSVVYVNDEKEVCVPYMLALPSFILGKLSTRAYWTPWDLLKVVEEEIKEYDGQIDAAIWNTMRDWCLAACQRAGNTDNSPLAIRVSPVAQLDKSFHRWFDYRLDMMFGHRHLNTMGFPGTATAPPTPPTAGNGGHFSPQQIRNSAVGAFNSGDLATQVGRGIALGLQAVTNGGLMAAGIGGRPTPTGGGDNVKPYSPDSIAAIKGFSGTADIKEVSTIWATFQTTKNADVLRRHLHFGMEQWARAQGVELDRGIFFEQKSIEDIVNLRFNPGQGVAQFKSAERGLSLLICRTRTPEEIERVRDREAAEQLTKATRVLEEALKLSRGDPRAPAGNYFELKLNITTFCALLFVLFGEKCDYYRALMLIRNCMDTPGVYNIRQAYTPDICHRISWAIIDEGCSFFSAVMIQQDFAKPTVTFPVSLMESILPEVRYANQIMRANYPQEWQPKGAPRHTAPPAAGATISWQPPGGSPPYQGQGQAGRATAAAGQGNEEVWEDVRHPRIQAMMAPYVEKLGSNVYVGEIMDAAGITVADLPKPTGTRFISKDGKKAYLCWNAVLGRCKFGKSCKYKKNHPKKNELPEEFATAVVAALQQAVNYVVSTKESPAKKLKVENTAA